MRYTLLAVAISSLLFSDAVEGKPVPYKNDAGRRSANVPTTRGNVRIQPTSGRIEFPGRLQLPTDQGGLVVEIPTGHTVTIPGGAIQLPSSGDTIVVTIPSGGRFQLPGLSEGDVTVSFPNGGTITIPGGRFQLPTGRENPTVSLPTGGRIEIPRGRIIQGKVDTQPRRARN